MKRTAMIAVTVLLAMVLSAGMAMALTASGQVSSVDGEGNKVVILLSKGQGENFPLGTRGINLKNGQGASLRGRVVAASGDKITMKIMRGKASTLSAGDTVTLERAAKTGGPEEMQGC